MCEDLFPLFLWQTLAQQLSGPRLHSACAVGGPNSPPSPKSAPPLPQAPPPQAPPLPRAPPPLNRGLGLRVTTAWAQILSRAVASVLVSS